MEKEKKKRIRCRVGKPKELLKKEQPGLSRDLSSKPSEQLARASKSWPGEYEPR